MAEQTAAARLREMLSSRELGCLVEAHDALSARIVQEAGLPGIWASSLTLSASRGLPDAGALSMSQVLDTLESMIESTHLPVLFDGDDGYGDLHQFQRLVQRLERRKVAGVCIEDKRVPKQNSFLRSESQALTDVGEQCAKLRAGKDAQASSEFVIVARTEALITGLGVDAALERAERYAEAGADAVLVHSKAPTFAEVQAFMRQWSGRVPVICVPTTYYATPLEAFRSAGISLVIWANHMLRAAITAMQHAAKVLAQRGSARELEDDIAQVSEIFRLQGVAEAERREEAYQWRAAGCSAIVLAASRGEGLDALTLDRPKAMLPVAGEPLLERLIRQLRSEGVRDIGVVRGYCAQAVTPRGVRLFDNRRFMETGEVGSLACALSMLESDVVIAYGDIVLRQHLLHELLCADAPITILVDPRREALERGPRAPRDAVLASSPPTLLFDERPVYLARMGPEQEGSRAHGCYMGLMRVRRAGAPLFRRALERVLAQPRGEQSELHAVLNALVSEAPEAVRVLYVQGDWLDINSLLDLARSQA